MTTESKEWAWLDLQLPETWHNPRRECGWIFRLLIREKVANEIWFGSNLELIFLAAALSREVSIGLLLGSDSKLLLFCVEWLEATPPPACTIAWVVLKQWRTPGLSSVKRDMQA